MESAPKILGRSLIAGAPGGPQKASEAADPSFRAVAPTTGQELAPPMYAATTAEVTAACSAAWEAFYSLAERPARERASLLDTAAANISALGDSLIDLASEETGLTPPRLVSERDRTVNTLRMFAETIREGSWVRASIDSPDATRRPLAKPDLRRMLLPVGPVAVFGASNFPLAYSAAGTDTSSALAAGCPVVVKGHPSHPGTGELVAHAINKAIKELGLHAGIYSYLHAGGKREQLVGAELVKNPCIRAVGFTGSYGGGMALHKLAAAERPDPIPVFAEMGSINPVFLLTQALNTSATSIAE